jgi:hypothetical protein
VTEIQTKKGLTGANLKWMAIILMAIDHIGAVIVEPMLLHPNIYQVKDWHTLYNVYMVLRALGRFSFPMFCFLMAEGFGYTRSKVKYLRNLLLFAVISEIPFDLALKGVCWDISYQNVFFTLALGLLAIWSGEELQKSNLVPAIENGKEIWVRISCIAVVAGMALIAELLNTDYGAIGVIVIFILYRRKENKISGAFFAWLILTLSIWLEVFCLPFVGAVKLYNGQRGKQNKYFFYFFYPVHLLLLYILKFILF